MDLANSISDKTETEEKLHHEKEAESSLQERINDEIVEKTKIYALVRVQILDPVNFIKKTRETS